MIMLLEIYIFHLTNNEKQTNKKGTPDHKIELHKAWITSNFENTHIMVQLHLDSSFGGFKLSPLIGAPTMRVVDLSVFSSLSVLVLL